MEHAGHPAPTSLKPRGDAVVDTLIRLIVVSRSAYREPLLDALFQYRRREGVFVDNPKIGGNRWSIRAMVNRPIRPILLQPPRGRAEGQRRRPAPSVKEGQERRRLPKPASGSALSL